MRATGIGPGLEQAKLKQQVRHFCDACLTGNYPVEIPVELGKHILELPSEASTNTTGLADTPDVAPTLSAQDALTFTSSEEIDG